MKPPSFLYACPRSLDEALTLLAEHGEDAKLWPAARAWCRC